MTSNCPICGKPVDSLRAPAVGVRSGKVVAYCSRECALAAETKPTRVVIEDTSLPPPEIEEPVGERSDEASGPRPSEKRATPASGVVVATGATAGAVATGAKIDATIDATAGAVAAGATAGAVAAAAAKSDKRTATPSAGVHTSAARPAPSAGVHTSAARPVSAPTDAPPPETSDKSDQTAGKGVVKQTAADFESAPVIEILHEPASGVVTSAPDRRVKEDDADDNRPKPKSDRKSGPAAAIPRGPFATGSFILESDDPDFEVDLDQRPRGKGLTVLLFVLLVVVAGGALGYKYLYLEHRWIFAHHQPAVPAPSTTPRPPAPIDAGSGLTAQVALERAQTVLRSLLRSSSPRVQQKAASALARTRDPEAVKWLADALANETERAPKMDIAYALGRAGDKRGGDALATLLGADRDARLYAAKKLAQLHDKRAVPTLVNYLGVSQNRLGAAAWLAPFDEPQALKALEEVRADAKSPDKQAEAAIALGTAKHADVTPALRELLGNPEWKGPAARALAELHDPAARPVLVEQLGSPQLRVDGARALRRLEPNLDAKPLLEPLVTALDTDKDLEQIHVAEAILLLAGPPATAEFD